jgi:hypothetical protein
MTDQPEPAWAAYEVRPFGDAQSLARVAEEWEKLAGSDEFEVELSALFEWCQSHLTPAAGEGHAMQVFNGESGQTDAILEMVSGKRGSLTKLLKIYVSPRYWPADRDLEVRDRFEALYTGIFVRVISASIGQTVVEEIRLYGRSDLMYVMLKSLAANWGSISGLMWSASMEGRWLSLKREAL